MSDLRLRRSLLALLLVGCHSTPVPSQKTLTPTTSDVPRVSAEAELAKLDGRTPVPLLPPMALHQKQNMREHLEAVQAIVAAAAQSDFAKIEEAALRIGYSEQMGHMCKHMGAGAPEFTDRALAFHHAADKVAAAARARDMTSVLAELGATLGKCTGCHASFKQQVVGNLDARP